ncbi:MAG: hypothetical protein ACPL4H_04115 [Anaerolineales bacterium]
MMTSLVTHFQSHVTIRRERFLPQNGKVLVRKGQKVSADEILAVCENPPQYLWLDYARGLGLPIKKADELLQVKVGQNVDEKEILAGPLGWAKRVVRSPQKGQVVLAGEGQLLLKVESSGLELRAGFEATVVDVIAGRGVILETSGALLQGIWGNGKAASAVLLNPYHAAEQELTVEHLTIDVQEAILVGGWISNPQTLKSAADFAVRGLILGGIEAKLLDLAKEMPYPILVLDGFGPIAMNSLAYQILSENERKFISINACEWERIKGTRPEAIIVSPAEENTETTREIVELSAGQTVRICRFPYTARIGRLERINPGRTILGNGLSVNAGVVILDDGEKVITPLEDLEVIL